MNSAAAEAAAEIGPVDTVPRDFNEIVRDHLDFVWRVLRRFGFSAEDAEDAAQQVFMIAADKADKLVPERERAFLYVTARRVAANQRRGQRRRREAKLDGWEDVLAPGPSPETRAELSRATELLDELLSQMPDDLARTLALAEMEQLTVPDIAELEGIPVGTAASRLRRARALFRELLDSVREQNPFEGRP